MMTIYKHDLQTMTTGTFRKSRYSIIAASVQGSSCRNLRQMKESAWATSFQ